MNPLFNDKQRTAPSFSDFAKTMTPDGAKKQIEQMMASGQITKAQVDEAARVARIMGFKM